MTESALSAQGFSRHKAESLMQWIERLNETAEISGTAELIESILPVHYRYRFDPRGLNAGERSALREAVNIWLELHTQKLRS